MWWLIASLALGAEDEPVDHPVVSRFAGSEALAQVRSVHDALDLPLGPAGSGLSERLEGALTRTLYLAPEATSSLEVAHGYAEALSAAGFVEQFECAGESCGAQFRRLPVFEPELVRYAIRGRLREPHYLAARLDGPSGSRWVSVFTAEHVSPNPGLAGRTLTEVAVLEEGPPREQMVVVDAEAMRRDLERTGRVALYGVYFDTGSAELLSTSGATLEEIATLLEADPELLLHVVGHTDGVGELDHNLELSARRAEAVVAALRSAHGVAASRLQAHGVGPLAPVADNRSEEGRARNRRVELVRR